MPRSLESLDISEISLVDRAANKKKRFHVIKEDKLNYLEILEKYFEEKSDPDKKVDLKKFMNSEDVKQILDENEDIKEMLEKAEKLPAKAMTALKGAYKILSKYKDDFTSELKKALETISKYVSYGYPEKSATEKMAVFDLENLNDGEIKKAGKALSKATIEELKKIQEIIDKLIGEKEEKQKVDGIDKLPEDVKKELIEYKKLKKKIEDEEKERVEKMEKELTELKKQVAKKTSIKGQDDEDADVKKGSDKWPSLGLNEEKD